MTHAISLNAPLGAEENGSELGEFVEDERISDADGEVIRDMERSFLHDAIEQLPERHGYIIRRYGLDNRGPSTLAVLSNKLKVSRQRIRQLQREAEHMLKSRMLTMGGAGGRSRVSTEASLP